MQIFLGSSKEALDLVREVEVWIEDNGMEPMPWDRPGLFPPGESTLSRLLEISRQVAGAIFIFSEDDHVWYRDDSVPQPRDNVLLEYGFFVGAVGPKRAIILRDGGPKEASDLRGITYIGYSSSNRSRARLETLHWCRSLSAVIQQSGRDTAVVQMEAKIAELYRAVDTLNERLSLEEDKTSELKRMLSEGKNVDFTRYDLDTDGHWKLLYDSDYFWKVSAEIVRAFPSPDKWAEELERTGARSVAATINWPLRDVDRTGTLVRKSLRVFRHWSRKELWPQFVAFTRPILSEEIVSVARIAMQKESTNRAAGSAE